MAIIIFSAILAIIAIAIATVPVTVILLKDARRQRPAAASFDVVGEANTILEDDDLVLQ